ncbi:DUF6541 family protein [Sinomonas halotolerans]|uniref:DUF6541 family protein n=1 Tax=Sinomonas halotolerans TaxID=1644133 RepID=A0ABU9WY48_9MICC
MTWLEAVPAVLAALVFLILPGIACGWALGFRSTMLLALAPGFSVSVIGVGSTVAPFVGLVWTPLTVAAATAAAAGALALLRLGVARRTTPVPRRRGRVGPWGVLGAAVGPAVIAAWFVSMVGSPENISQTFDNVFHLNAVRYIQDTGQASSLTVGQMTNAPYYPAVWHAFAALVADASATNIPVAVNGANLAIAAVAWPLGCIALVRQAVGERTAGLVVAGILSAGFAAFPLLLLYFGVLYPTALGVALLPAALALAVQAVRLSAVDDVAWPLAALACAWFLPGLALAHPSMAMALFAFFSPVALVAWFRAWAVWRKEWPASRRRALLWTAAGGIGMAGAAAAWVALRPSPGAAFWDPVRSIGGALLEVATLSPLLVRAAVVVSVLTALGLVLLAVRRWRGPAWALGVYALGAFLFIVVASFPEGLFRYLLTGTWYSDSYRLAALLPTVAVVPAAVGALWLWDLLAKRLPRRRVLAGAVAAAVLAASSQLGSIPDLVDEARASYTMSDDSPLLTTDEAAVLDDVSRLVPADAVIFVNPGTGSALAYALAGRRTSQLHILTGPRPPELVYLLLHLHEGGPRVCDAVRKLGVSYALDFGSKQVNDERRPGPGLLLLNESPVATLLARHGSAALYEITGCP